MRFHTILFALSCLMWTPATCQVPNLQYLSEISPEDLLQGLSSMQPSAQSSRMRSTSELITSRGYGAEKYKVITEDGYILSLTRIRRKKPVSGGKMDPVLLMHGLCASSELWLVATPSLNLPFTLTESGYDVWIADQRGNANSKSHIAFSNRDEKYWDFSFHEMAAYDLPALIDFVLKKSGKAQVYYVGHSLGGTNLLALCSYKPSYNLKLKGVALLGPVATVPYTDQLPPLLRRMLQSVDSIYDSLMRLKLYEFLPRNSNLQTFVERTCNPSSSYQNLCLEIVDYIMGTNLTNWDPEKVAYYMKNYPNGSSTKTTYHGATLYKTGRFGTLDYGPQENLRRYGSFTPPIYNLSLVTAPIAIYSGINDKLASLKNSDFLARSLPRVVLHYIVPDVNYGHADFLFGLNTKELVYKNILGVFRALS